MTTNNTSTTKYITLNLWSVSGKWSDIRKMSGGYKTDDQGQTVPANDGNYIANFEPEFFVSMMFNAIDFNDALEQARNALDWEISTANEIVSIENMGGANYGSAGETYKAFETRIFSKCKDDVIAGIKASTRGLDVKPLTVDELNIETLLTQVKKIASVTDLTEAFSTEKGVNWDNYLMLVTYIDEVFYVICERDNLSIDKYYPMIEATIKTELPDFTY